MEHENICKQQNLYKDRTKAFLPKERFVFVCFLGKEVRIMEMERYLFFFFVAAVVLLQPHIFIVW